MHSFVSSTDSLLSVTLEVFLVAQKWYSNIFVVYVKQHIIHRVLEKKKPL